MPFTRATFFLFYFPDLCHTELACTNANGCEILTSGLDRCQNIRFSKSMILRPKIKMVKKLFPNISDSINCT